MTYNVFSGTLNPTQSTNPCLLDNVNLSRTCWPQGHYFMAFSSYSASVLASCSAGLAYSGVTTWGEVRQLPQGAGFNPDTPGLGEIAEIGEYVRVWRLWPQREPVTQLLFMGLGGKAHQKLKALCCISSYNPDAVVPQYLSFVEIQRLVFLMWNFKPAFCVKEICRIISHPVTIWLCTTVV